MLETKESELLQTLTERDAAFRSILADHAVDEFGIVRSTLHFDGLRPLEDADMPHAVALVPGVTPSALHSYEDAGMATGAFLAAQSLRFRLTGAREARRLADQAFAGIRSIYDLGRTTVEGFFPKPYGGRSSSHTSRDQYLFVLAGLHAYYGIADPARRQEIAQMAAKMADYWISINYTTKYFHLPPSSHLADFMGSLFLGLIRIAHMLSGQDRLLREYERLYHDERLGPRMRETLRAELLAGAPYDGGTYFRQHQNSIMMKCMAIDHLYGIDLARQTVWDDALVQFWNDDALVSLDPEDGLNYFLVGFDPARNETFLTEPGVIPGMANPLGLAFLTWGGRRKTPGSAQTAFSCAVIADRLGLGAARDTGLGILQRLTLDTFRGLTVPSPEHVPPGSEHQLAILNTACIAFWEWAYWLGRGRALW